LFDLGKIVLYILIRNELAGWAERELAVWPDFGEVEDIVAELLCLARHHCLLEEESVLH
jgi:hypothetical protein